MLYSTSNTNIDNFAWSLLVDPLANLFGKGTDKINDQRHTIADMWGQFMNNQNAQTQAQILADQQKAIADQQKAIAAAQQQKQNQLLIIAAAVVVLAVILYIIFKN